VPEVAADLERRIRLPARPVEIEERTHGPLPVARDGAEPLLHRLGERLERNGAVEQSDAADVHALVRLLPVEEGGIERRKTLRAGHVVTLRWRRSACPPARPRRRTP